MFITIAGREDLCSVFGCSLIVRKQFLRRRWWLKEFRFLSVLSSSAVIV